jgi:tetratricopeptide (TPR) repeat protein
VGGPKTLSRADRLLRARKYSQVISLLESQVFLYRENFTFYRLLGTACLYAGDYGGAYSYLQRAQQIKRDDPRVELGLAAVHLRRREIPEALAMWLSVLDRDPKNARARRGLALIRRTEDTSEFITMAESGRLARFFPPLGFHMPLWVPIALVAALLIAAAVLYLPDLLQILSGSGEPAARRRRARSSRPELPAELVDPACGERCTHWSEHEIAVLVATGRGGCSTIRETTSLAGRRTGFSSRTRLRS